MNALVSALPKLVDLLAFVGVAGTLAWGLWVLPPPSAALPERSGRGFARIRLLLLVSVLGLTVTTPILLLLRAADMGRQTLLGAVPLLPKVLAASHYGSVWQMRAAAVVLLWLGLWGLSRGARVGARRAVPLLAMMSIAMLAIAWSYSASGHASAFGDFSLLQIIDCLHIAATTMWMGGLVVLATAARPLFSSVALTAPDRAYAAEAAERLSRLSALALAGVVLTGVYNAVNQIGSWDGLMDTGYGRLFLAKLAGVSGMVALGTFNRYRGLPRLKDWAGRVPAAPAGRTPGERFLRVATLEALLAVGVLALTALLTGAMPPREADHVTSTDISLVLRPGRFTGSTSPIRG